MSESYTRQLHADSLTTLLPLITGIIVLLSLSSLIVQEAVWIPIATIFISLATFQWTRTLLGQEKQENAGWVYVGMHLLLITMNWYLLWTPESNFSFIPFLYAIFILISSVVIKPMASLQAWLLTFILMILIVALKGELRNVEALTSLSIITLVNLSLAGISRLSTVDWEIALDATSQLHLKVRNRRDELFDVQQELQRTNDRFQFLNEQLEQT